MKKKSILAVVLSLCLISGASYAQLYKCVESDGSITFTKHGCSTSSEAEAVRLGSVNTQDNSGVRSKSAEREFERSLQPAQTRVTVVADPRIEERKNKERKEFCREATTPYKGMRNGQLTIRQGAVAEQCASGASLSEIKETSERYKRAARAARASAPSHITTCDSGGCWDNLGNRYNGSAGSTHFRQDGRVCQDVGGQMICN